ncbi:UNKNOWN [Stylonychia lemnae]|uniref:LITAF domain-containing protein n=1 Tax=Stylonychia lemnae TaxID=5949 RepID=A0A078A3D9_STYLE|nr:UNKNOWN [Stylonychia lemnae]|eukprot:CDW76028.1 UNKNOWN [Stylonychia lemnae]
MEPTAARGRKSKKQLPPKKKYQEDLEIEDDEDSYMNMKMMKKMEKLYGQVYNDLLTFEEAEQLKQVFEEQEETNEHDGNQNIDINQEELQQVLDLEQFEKIMRNQEDVEEFIEQAQMLMEQIQEAEEKIIRFHLGLAKQIKCQFCEHKGSSIIEERNTYTAYLLSIIVLILLGWFGILFVPFCLGLLRQQIHRCAKCLNAVKEKSLFSSLEDNILSLSIGKFGIIIKRRTLVKSFVFLLLSSFIFYIFKHYYIDPLNDYDHFQFDENITWSSYLTDCGRHVQLEQARQHFYKRYKLKHIQWQGYVMRVDANEESQVHFAKILVQMDRRDYHPSEQDFAEREPDLVITLTEAGFERNQKEIEELRRGDIIRFNATISHFAVQKAQGDLSKYNNEDEQQVHHLHGIGIEKIGHKENDDIKPHYHWDGRFQFNQDLQNKDFNVDGTADVRPYSQDSHSGHHHH